MNSAVVGDALIKKQKKSKKKAIPNVDPVKQPKKKVTPTVIINEAEDKRIKLHTDDLQAPTPIAIVNEIKKGEITVKETSPGIFLATSTTSNYMIEYDRNKCIGAASCAAIAPLTFFMNEENLAEFNTQEGKFDDDETILSGAQSCPVFAIRILDKVTNEVIFPIE
jgi:ferredoxin